jgi:hypothetical protein
MGLDRAACHTSTPSYQTKLAVFSSPMLTQYTAIAEKRFYRPDPYSGQERTAKLHRYYAWDPGPALLIQEQGKCAVYDAEL